MPDAEELPDQEALHAFLRGSSDREDLSEREDDGNQAGEWSDADDESASSASSLPSPSPPRTATQALVEDWDSTDSSPSELREVIRIF